LEHLLAAPSKRQIKHLAALPYQQLPEFMAKLRAIDTVPARALKFLILTAARRGEVRGARWSEIDFDSATWVIPGERMKRGKEHRVPLSPRCMEILREARANSNDEYIFPGRNGGLGESAFEHLLKRLGYPDITTHGFRSAFKTWASEQTAFPETVVEQALAHAVGNAVQRAYARTDLFDRRRQLMQAWETFCSKPMAAVGATVTALRA
jgi:integrase